MKLDTASIILVLAMLLALRVGMSSGHDQKEEDGLYAEPLQSDEYSPSLLRGPNRLLGNKYYSPPGKKSERLTCNVYPRICHVRGSPGPDCCKKKCVNVKTDSLNCGMCGYKCGHQESCCNGRCVNLMRDRKHCGGCGNKCANGDVCYYGMCSYA